MAGCGSYEAQLDARGAIVAVGERLAALCGASPSELIGRPATRYLRGAGLTAPPGSPAPLEVRSESRGATTGVSVRILDGERVALTFVPEVAHSGRPREPREPDGKLVADLVREVHDALTGIVGFASLAQVAPTPHRRKFYLEQVGTQGERCRRLVQALDPGFFARATFLGAADLVVELERALAGTRLALERQGIAFELAQTSGSTWASCDARQIGDMVVALVQRATLAQRRDFQANEVVVSVEPGAGVVRVVVLLAAADQPQVLLREPFGTEDDGRGVLTAAEQELRLAQAALARQGGTFEIVRDPDLEEVRLVLTLPSSPPGRVRDQLRTPVPLEVLALDGDAMIGELYQELLAVSGHNVTSCGSLEAAREALRGQRFDVVVAEFHFKDGLLSELWATASEAHPELASRLLVVTRDPRDPRLVEWAQLHHIAILAKPFHATALLDRVALLGG